MNRGFGTWRASAAVVIVSAMPAALAVAAAAVVGSALAVSRVRTSWRDGLAVTWHRVPWKGERKIRVVQLTDIHMGPTTPRHVISRVASVVETLESDLVVMTGDYVNASLFFLGRVSALVRALPKPLIATLGNHDHWTDAVRITSTLQGAGAHVLRNESTVVDVQGERFTVVGVDDGCTKHADVRRAFAKVESPDRALVLTHFPNTALEIAETGAPLVLAGHTHAGQVDVPRATRAVAKLTGNPYLGGFYRVGEATDLYVNAGLGHSLPGFRAGRTCPEIAVFELDPGAKERRSCALRTSWS